MHGTRRNLALPPETTDKIIDLLYDDHIALARGSLVHSTWRPRAQWLLYTSIFLRDRPAYAALRSLVQSNTGDTRAIIKHHCKHTKHLEIRDDQCRPYAHELPLTFSSRFPVLQSITYRDARWHKKTHLRDCVFHSLSMFSCVAALELHACHFQTFREFVRFVCALPSLRDLTLVKVKLGKRSLLVIEPTAARRGKELELRRLHVEHLVSGSDGLDELLTWLVRTPSGLRTVQDLQIRPNEEILASAFHLPLETLLGSLGASLTSLDVPIFFHDGSKGLCANNQLRSLVLRHTFQEGWEMAWGRIMRMLASITSIYLRSLELVFTFLMPTTVDVGEVQDIMMSSKDIWGPINDVISSKSFGVLEKATITVEWHVEDTQPTADFERLQGVYEEAMKELHWHKRRILVMTHHKHSYT